MTEMCKECQTAGALFTKQYVAAMYKECKTAGVLSAKRYIR